MRILCVVLLVAAIGLAGGCGRKKGAWGVADKILRAVKEGDTEAVVERLDLHPLYDQVVAEKEAGGATEAMIPEFDVWKEQFIEEGKKDAKPNKAFDYEILKSDEQADTATVTVKMRWNVKAEWKTHELTFKKIDDAWKMTAEAFTLLGYFEPEPKETPKADQPADDAPDEAPDMAPDATGE